MNKLYLKRVGSWYNPYSIIDDKWREIGDIIFYDTNGKVFATNCGWFRDAYNNPDSIIINNINVRRANKIKFDKNDCFYILSPKERIGFDRTVDLYIPITLLTNFEKEEDVFDFKTEDYSHYYDMYRFSLGEYRLKVKNNCQTKYTEKYLKRTEIFGKLDITSDINIVNALRKLKENNIDLNDIV